MPSIDDVILFDGRRAKGATVAIDPAMVVRGSPTETTEILFASENGRFTVGLWESDDGAWTIVTSEDEFVALLEGDIVVTDNGGRSRRFVPGQSFFVPSGFEGTWENVGLVRKIFVSLRGDAADAMAHAR